MVNNMMQQMRKIALFSSIFKRTIIQFPRKPCYFPITWNVVRILHVNLPNNFKISSILDKKHVKDYTDKDWRTKLSPEQYHVCREKGTEPPWSGELINNKEAGMYCCVCCDADLFNSTTKYDSESGWPSFWASIEHAQTKEQNALGIPNLSVDQQTDNSHGIMRVEALCKECGSHLGHVFGDGPKPSGLRYCINSIVLRFKPNMSMK